MSILYDIFSEVDVNQETGYLDLVQDKVNCKADNLADHVMEIHDKVFSVTEIVRELQDKVEFASKIEETRFDKLTLELRAADNDIQDMKRRQQRLESLLHQMDEKLSKLVAEE